MAVYHGRTEDYLEKTKNAEFYLKRNWCEYIQKRLMEKNPRVVSATKARSAESICFECKRRMARMLNGGPFCYTNDLGFKPI